MCRKEPRVQHTERRCSSILLMTSLPCNCYFLYPKDLSPRGSRMRTWLRPSTARRSTMHTRWPLSCMSHVSQVSQLGVA